MKQGYLLPTFMLFILTLSTIAQKAKVLSAYKHHQIYLSNKKCADLSDAKEAVDLAVNDIQTSQWAKSWYYRGNIYFDISVSEDEACNQLSERALHESYEAYNRSLVLDIKKHYTTDIQTKMAVIGPYFLNEGVRNYNDELYKEALDCFEKSVAISKLFDKTDSLALYNAALSAEQVKDYKKAQQYYTELIEVDYGGAKIHSFLSNIHLMEGNTENQLNAIKDGRVKYPQDQNLIIEELNYYLEHEHFEEALQVLQVVIKSNPGDYILHYYQGAVYDNLKKYDEAATAYSKSIVLNPSYFDSNYNMGVLYYNQGVELNELAYSEETNEKKRLEAKAKFEKALPYLEKANTINSFDEPTLLSLQKIYSILGNDEGYQRVTEELEN